MTGPSNYADPGDCLEMSSVDGPQLEAGEVTELEWKAGKKEYALMITIAVISLMVALDATILVSVLPVRIHPSCLSHCLLEI